MPDLKPIPTPLSQRWRLFRTRLMPVLVFMAAIGAMVWLWDQESAPGVMVGEVYAPSSTVNSPRDGWLEGGAVELFREVRAGEEIGIIRTMPPEHAQLALAVLREEIQMIQLGVGDPVLDQQRNLLSLQGLRQDWLLAPVVIYAPFDGQLTKVFRHPGDFLNLGEPIAEIRSKHAESIIGYLKAPFSVHPEVGMEVNVVPRSSWSTAAARAIVLSVGPQFEALQPAFLRSMPAMIEERALPVLISLPEQANFVPGDIVDIRMPKLTN